MGNDNIDLCDRKWNERFREKVMEEYERQQILREKQLAEAEVRRIQKLRLQGTLCDEEDEEGTRGSKRNGSQKRGKKKSEKYLEGRKSKHQTLYIKPNDDVETQMQGLKTESSHENGLDDSEQDEADEQDQKAQDMPDSGHYNGSQKDDDQGKTGSDENYGQNDQLPNDQNNPQTNQTSGSGKSDLDSRMVYSYKSQLGRAHTGQENHSELQRLYDLEDLRELYAEAESLVRLSRKK